MAPRLPPRFLPASKPKPRIHPRSENERGNTRPPSHPQSRDGPRHSSGEVVEQNRGTGSGGDGAKGGGQGERDPAPHVPDTEPGKRVTDAGARTDGRRLGRHYPRWEPDAGKPLVRICAGGPG